MSRDQTSRPGTSLGVGARGGGARGGADSLAAVAQRLRTPMYVSDRAMPPEEETIRAIEGKLHIAGANQSEEAFVMQSRGRDGLCSDPLFPPGPAALYPDPAQLPAGAIYEGALTWRRVEGVVYLPTTKTPRLRHSSGLQNMQFLSALAAVATRQDLLLDLIVSDDHAEQGAYTMQVYKHGCWHQVVVDNQLPCLDEGGLAFASSSNLGELWPSFIEKAYAKVHGSYYALEGGSVGEALVDLTGGVVSKVYLDTDNWKKESDGLWSQLTGLLESGAIVVCKAKTLSSATSGDPSEEHAGAGGGSASLGPSGLRKNQHYTILECLRLDSGDRLLRLHCPWSVGLWEGAWAPGSEELAEALAAPASSFAESSEATERLQETQDDPATFWISLKDFATLFNRVHICRLFPSSWHQLTLHCGWQGPSAGGPYYSKIGDKGGESILSPSSTWCCNPQFRITVRKAGEVVICLGQVDPRVENKRHVRKQLRRRSIGMQILKIPLTSLGRRWSVGSNELLLEVPLTQGREACVSFQADPAFAYVVVPYAGRSGDEGAFVLRTFSSGPLEMEQLPSPLSLVLGGQWAGILAGGPRQSPTFGSNPQYMISSRHRTQVTLSVSRLDVRYSIIKPEHKPEGCVGLLILEPDKEPSTSNSDSDTGGGGSALGRCTAVRSADALKVEAGFQGMEEAVVSFVLEPEAPYLVVPCLASAGLEAPFELRIMSGVPVELVPLPEEKCITLQGEWKEGNSGGCDLSPVWKRNPRYILAMASHAKVKITVTRLVRGSGGANGGTLKTPVVLGVDDMVGFYVLKASEPTGEVKGDLRQAIIFESTFTTTPENAAEVDLVGGQAYVIMPCTYGQKRMGKFTLGLVAAVDYDFMEL